MYWCVGCVSMWVCMCHSISVESRGHLRYQSSSSTLSETKSYVCPEYTRVAGFHAPEDSLVSTSISPKECWLQPCTTTGSFGLWGAHLGFSHLHDFPLFCWTISLLCDDFTLLAFQGACHSAPK